MQHILVPIDFGPASQKALEWAAGLQHAIPGCALRVIHVLNPMPYAPHPGVQPGISEDEIAAVRARLRARIEDCHADATAEAVLAHDVEQAILDAGRHTEATLIVMGTHGHSGLRRPALGRVAEFVVRHAPCPVVLVRGAPALEIPARAA